MSTYFAQEEHEADEKLIDKRPQDISQFQSYHLLDEAIEELGVGRYQRIVFWLSIATLFLNTSELSLTPLLFVEFTTEWHVSATKLALVGSLAHLGNLAGGIFFGWFSDTYGRVRGIMPTLFASIVIGFASSFAHDVICFSLFRMFLAFFIQGLHIMTNILLVESVPTSSQASMVVQSSVAVSISHAMMVLLAWLLFPTMGWRFVLQMVAVFSIPVFFLAMHVTESPRYYIMKGDGAHAEECIRFIAKKNGKKSPAYFCSENLVRTRQESRCRCFRSKDLLTLLPIGLVWMTLSIGSGLLGFLPMELKRFLGGTETAYIVALVLALSNFIATGLNLYCIRSFRRITMIQSTLLISAGLVLLLGVIGRHTVAIFVVVFVMHMFCGLTSGTLYVYISEVSPTRIRASSTAFVLCFSKLGGIIGPFIAAVGYSNLSVFWFCFTFSMIYLAAAIFGCLLTVDPFVSKTLVEDDDLPQVLPLCTEEYDI